MRLKRQAAEEGKVEEKKGLLTDDVCATQAKNFERHEMETTHKARRNE